MCSCITFKNDDELWWQKYRGEYRQQKTNTEVHINIQEMSKFSYPLNNQSHKALYQLCFTLPLFSSSSSLLHFFCNFSLFPSMQTLFLLVSLWLLRSISNPRNMSSLLNDVCYVSNRVSVLHPPTPWTSQFLSSKSMPTFHGTVERKCHSVWA